MTDEEFQEMESKYPSDPMPSPKNVTYWQGGDLWVKTDEGLQRWRSVPNGFRRIPIR